MNNYLKTNGSVMQDNRYLNPGLATNVEMYALNERSGGMSGGRE